MSLKHLKVGDKIFVVQQRRRGDTEDRTSEEVITRVGRKYAYFEHYRQEVPFCRETGRSVHSKDCNARSNGYGFDVYVREEDYQRMVFNNEQARSLKDRICDRWSGLRKLPPAVVDEMLDVLDKHGVTSPE